MSIFYVAVCEGGEAPLDAVGVVAARVHPGDDPRAGVKALAGDDDLIALVPGEGAGQGAAAEKQDAQGEKGKKQFHGGCIAQSTTVAGSIAKIGIPSIKRGGRRPGCVENVRSPYDLRTPSIHPRRFATPLKEGNLGQSLSRLPHSPRQGMS